MLKRLLPLFFALCSIVISGFSQPAKDSSASISNKKLFYGVTYSLWPDIEKGPVNVYPNYIAENNPNPPYPQRGNSGVFIFNTNFASIGGELRYNILPCSRNSSISLLFTPSFGVGFTVVDEPDIYQIVPFANCSYNFPLALEFSIGAGANRNSHSEYGLYTFIGIENTGLVFKNNIPTGTLMDMNGNYYSPSYVTNWTEACIGLGVRYKSHKKAMRGIFIKYGFGPSQLYVSPYERVQSASPWTLKIGFSHCL